MNHTPPRRMSFCLKQVCSCKLEIEYNNHILSLCKYINMTNHIDKLGKYYLCTIYKFSCALSINCMLFLHGNNGVMYAQCKIPVNAITLLLDFLFLSRDVQFTASINGTLHYHHTQDRNLINTGVKSYQYCQHIKVYLLITLTQLEISMHSKCKNTCPSPPCTINIFFLNHQYSNIPKMNNKEIPHQCYKILTHTGDQLYQCSNDLMTLFTVKIISIKSKSYYSTQNTFLSPRVDKFFEKYIPQNMIIIYFCL